MKKVLIWDLPTRLFHWILSVATIFSIYTGLTGGFVEMQYHMYSGYLILGLVFFRLGWGFLGSYYSRFTSFVKGPASIQAYLKNLFRNQVAEEAGHNPLGAISIVVMLILFLLQAATGLFANDDIMTEGPLTHLVSYELSRSFTSFHKFNFWLIIIMVGLHLLAIAFYSAFKKQSLILPMITGNKYLPEDQPVTPYKSRWLVAVCLLAMVTSIIFFGLKI